MQSKTKSSTLERDLSTLTFILSTLERLDCIKINTVRNMLNVRNNSAIVSNHPSDVLLSKPRLDIFTMTLNNTQRAFLF